MFIGNVEIIDGATSDCSLHFCGLRNTTFFYNRRIQFCKKNSISVVNFTENYSSLALISTVAHVNATSGS